MRSSDTFRGFLGLAFLCLWTNAVLGQQPTAPAPSGEERKSLLAERKELWDRAIAQADEQKPAEAARLGAQVLALEKRLFGQEHEEITETLRMLAIWHVAARRLDKATEATQARAAMIRKLHGEDAWQTMLADQQRDYIDRLSKAPADKFAALRSAEDQYDRLVTAQKHGEAAEAAEKLVELEKPVLGAGHPFVANSYVNIAEAHLKAKSYPQAEAAACQARDIRRQSLGSKHPDTADALALLGRVLAAQEKYKEALTPFSEALSIYDAASQTGPAASMCGWQGNCARDAGDMKAAAAAYREALSRYTKLNNQRMAAFAARELGQAQYSLKEFKEAIGHLETARQSYAAQERPADVASMLRWLGDAHGELGDQKTAADFYGQALAGYQKLNDQQGISESASKLGLALYRQKEYMPALSHLQTASAAYEARGKPREAAYMLVYCGACQRGTKDFAAAIKSYSVALAGFDKLKYTLGQAPAALGLAEAHLGLEQFDEAEARFRQAIAALESASKTEQIQPVKDRLAACGALKMRSALQGVWRVVEGGNPFLWREEAQFVFDGDKAVLIQGAKVNEYTYTLDLSHTPARIDLAETGEKAPYLGIFELDGDGLKLCHGIAPGFRRPAEFVRHLIAEPGKGGEKFVLRRAPLPLVPAEISEQFPAPLTKGQRVQVALMDCYLREVTQNIGASRLDIALGHLKRVLSVQRSLYGPLHDEVASTLETIYQIHYTRMEFDAARADLGELMDLRVKKFGEKHWQVTDTQHLLAKVDWTARLTPEQHQELARADELYEQFLTAYQAGQLREALNLVKQEQAIKERLTGEKDVDYITGLNNIAQLSLQLGDFATAEKLLSRTLDLRKEVQGEQHPAYATSLNNLGELQRLRGDLPGATKTHQRALEIRKEVVGEKHPDYAQSLNNVAILQILRGQYVAAEKLLSAAHEIYKAQSTDSQEYAQSLNNLGGVYEKQGDYVRAEAFYREGLTKARAAQGTENLTYFSLLDNLAGVHEGRGEFLAAEKLIQEALPICQKVLDAEHPTYAALLRHLADVQIGAARYQEAEVQLNQALKILRELPIDSRPQEASCLMSLGTLSRRRGDYSRAEKNLRDAERIIVATAGDQSPRHAELFSALGELFHDQSLHAAAEKCYTEARDMYAKLLGEEHPTYGLSLNNLGLLYLDTGDLVQAEQSLEKAAQIVREVAGETHPGYASCLNNLAGVYWRQGNLDDAAKLLQRSLAVRGIALGESHPEYGASLNNLATIYSQLGRYEDAEPLSLRAAEIARATYDENHFIYAKALNTLACSYLLSGKTDRARQPLERAEKILAVLGDDNLELAIARSNLGTVHFAAGNYQQAEALLARSLAAAQQNFELASAVQSERRQLAMAGSMRHWLDLYLSLAAAADISGDAAYAQALAWKGSVLARQHTLTGLARQQPALVPLLGQLQAVSAHLAQLVSGHPEPDRLEEWRKEVSNQTALQERLESQLAQQSTAFRKQQARRQYTPRDIQVVLPEATALVDLLEYTRLSPRPGGQANWSVERRLAAFVVRRGKPIVQVDLGPAEKVADAVEEWRSTFGAARGTNQSGLALRKLVWEPLEVHLLRVQTLLISPDGPLAGLPWGALPGKAAGTYLIEERSVVLAPSPQLLPEFLVPEVRSPMAKESLLVVSGINFDADAGKSVADTFSAADLPPAGVRGGERNRYQALSGMAAEGDALAALFRRIHPTEGVTPLKGDSATESAFCKSAAGKTYIHLATHGYFAAEGLGDVAKKPSLAEVISPITTIQSEAVGRHPGLLSGIVFAGANRPAQDGRDNGILTALELSGVDLSHARLMVLSACETGLGKQQEGEGVIGLTRACHAAGAQTVVASLWKVPDLSTRLLMERFYDNLWNKKMGKLAALQEAQKWMLRHGAERPEVLREAKARGVDEVDIKPAAGKSLPPYFWAAFYLSGDWR